MEDCEKGMRRRKIVSHVEDFVDVKLSLAVTKNNVSVSKYIRAAVIRQLKADGLVDTLSVDQDIYAIEVAEPHANNSIS